MPAPVELSEHGSSPVLKAAVVADLGVFSVSPQPPVIACSLSACQLLEGRERVLFLIVSSVLD